MKRLIIVVIGLMIVGTIIGVKLDSGPHPAAKAPDPRYGIPAISSQVVEDTKGFTVLISNETMDGISRGSGILLSSTTVMTCAHVLPEDKTIKGLRHMWIYPYPGDRVVHAAKVKFVNYPNDIALIELSSPVIVSKYPVFARRVTIGEPILGSGNILGYMMWFVSYGIITGEHQRWILTDATIHGGNSGGPWVNARGEVVAMTDVGWRDRNGADTGISGGVPAGDLQEFLAEAAKKKPSIMYALTGE